MLSITKRAQEDGVGEGKELVAGEFGGAVGAVYWPLKLFLLSILSPNSLNFVMHWSRRAVPCTPESIISFQNCTEFGARAVK